MRLEDYRPVSQLVTETHRIDHPKFPVVESHGHINLNSSDSPPPERLLERMDEAGISRFMDLDAGVVGPDGLAERVNLYKERYPDRFHHAAGIDWATCIAAGPRLGEVAARQLRDQHGIGATALKIWKNIGLNTRENDGRVLMIDDPRLEILWETAAESKMPVYVHVGDPLAFFKPVDERNERYEELSENPDWQFGSSSYPGIDRIISGFEKVVCDNPRTTFIGAHVGCIAEDLRRVDRLLDKCPNYHIDLSARLNELGRQPYSALEFIKKNADRILFGTDTDADLGTCRVWYRFLETRDEYFSYHTSSAPDQGRWNIYGIGLEDELLKKIYSGTAERLLFN